MAANEIHQNDIGTTFVVTLKDGDAVVDISSAAIKEIIFKDPNNTLLVKTASYTTDGTDGKLQYTTVSGDLDQVGMWRMQALVKLGSYQWKSDIQSFKVHSNLV